jgi:hypothetical protein
MTSRHDQVMTVSDDGKHIELVNADQFSKTHAIREAEPNAAESSQTDSEV